MEDFTNVEEIQQFADLCRFYRRHVQNFPAQAVPLYQQTKSNFIWTQEHQKAFESLNERLLNHAVFEFPDLPCPFMVTCDGLLSDLHFNKLISSVGTDWWPLDVKN